MFFRAKPLDPPTLDLELGGQSVTLSVNRSSKARRYSLRIPATGGTPVLTIPQNGSLRTAQDFAKRHSAWLEERLAKVPTPITLLAGAYLPLRGVEHQLISSGTSRGTVRAMEKDGQPCLQVSGETDHFSRRLTDWLKREARTDLTKSVDRFSTQLGRKPSGLSIRDTRTRWGSCSSTGRLSFSWRLILAPPWILDYVAAHEVAHLAEMNHSQRFWRLTEDLFPATPDARQWLRDHGTSLHRFG